MLQRYLLLSRFSYILPLLIFTINAYSQVPAFPGADGFGKYTTGGRGGAVIEVVNLNDHGEGSLREAIDTPGPRTIVFRVSGTIFLESPLRIDEDNLTIAGQTSPGDGITLAGYYLNLDASNVIIRYIRSRMGDINQQETDAFTCREQENIIIDHCSFSWSVDETASCYLNKNFTMQWCIISESLYNSVHSKGSHGYGGIWGGSRASFHHNLLAHHTSRNPRFNGARYIGSPWEEIVDFRNNVVYNWGYNSAYGGEPSEIDGIKANINMVNNYYKYGPATNTGEMQYRIVSPDPQGTYGFSRWYIDGNAAFEFPQVLDDNWTYGVQGVTPSEKEDMKSDTAFEFLISNTQTAAEAYDSVLLNAGVIVPRRDTIDSRIIQEVRSGEAHFGGSYGAGTGIIDSQTDVGGWPELFSDQAPEDKDHDGMADDWELAKGLDPENPEDRNGDMDEDGYTNLEEYLNSIVKQGYFINPPTLLSAGLTGLTKISLNWADNSGDETGFLLERSTGSDYVLLKTLSPNTETYIDSLLEPGTEYIYRLRSFNDQDTSVYSESNPVSTPAQNDPPLKAADPYPGPGSQKIPSSVTLSWSAGIGSTSHKVYFGSSGEPDLLTETTDTSVLVPDLSYGTRYYWRVDEVNENGETKGDLWYFVTEVNLSDILVGFWKFETISAAYDSSLFANHGIYHNFLPFSITSSGAVGNAIRFNGVNQYILIPDADVYDFGQNSFTIGMWIKQASSDVDPEKQIEYLLKGSRIKNPSGGTSGKRYEIYYRPEGMMCFTVDDSQNQSEITTPSTPFITGQWVYLTAVRDFTAKELRLYHNGNLVASAPDITSDLSQGEELYLGYNPLFGNNFKGAMDEVRLYNYALNEDEIKELVQAGPVSAFSEHPTGFVEVFPNPARDKVFLSLPSNGNNSSEIMIFDLNGKMRMKKSLHHYSQKLSELDVSYLDQGVYIIIIKTGQDTFRNKLLIQR